MGKLLVDAFASVEGNDLRESMYTHGSHKGGCVRHYTLKGTSIYEAFHDFG